MPATVCCPTCWSWSKPGQRTTCRRCGTPLIYADGRPVAPIAAPPDPVSPDGHLVQAQSAAEPSTPPSHDRASRRPLGASLAATLVVAVAASVGFYVHSTRDTPALAPRDVVLTAASRAGGESVRISMTVDESFTVSGPAAPQFGTLSGQSLSLTMQLEMQNRQRSSATVTAATGGRSFKVLAVLYDGSLFLSQDDGATFQTVPLAGQPSSQYGPDNALQYLQAVSTVSDMGPGSADGVAVERYHAELDGQKITGVIKSSLSALKSSVLQRVADSMRFTGGSLDANIDRAGHVVDDRGYFDATFDLQAIDPSLRGTTMSIHATVAARFSDYGAAISVNRPSNVSGAATLP